MGTILQVARLRSKHEQQFKVDQEDAYQSGNNSENARKITELRGEVRERNCVRFKLFIYSVKSNELALKFLFSKNLKT